LETDSRLQRGAETCRLGTAQPRPALCAGGMRHLVLCEDSYPALPFWKMSSYRKYPRRRTQASASGLYARASPNSKTRKAGGLIMVFKRGRFYSYRFLFDGQMVQHSTRQSNRDAALKMDAAESTRLGLESAGLESP